MLQEEGLFDALKTFAKNGGAFFGTCAGAILLAKQLHGPPQDSLGLLDISVLRNGYGRRLAATSTPPPRTQQGPLEMAFIPAPIIDRWAKTPKFSPKMQAAESSSGRQSTRIHLSPELTNDSTVHEYFLKLVGNGRNGS